MSRRRILVRPLGVIAAAALVGSMTAAPAYAISGGQPVPDGTYAFAAKVTGDGRACGGALIDPEWVVTAKACVEGFAAADLTITVGRTDLSTGQGHQVRATRLVAEPERNVTLVRLATRMTGVTPVAIGDTGPTTGETLRVAGYGRTGTEWVPDRLQAATFVVRTVTESTVDIVGVPAGTTGICKGDAGGPAFRERDGRVELVAVHQASWQTGCLGETETRQGAIETRVDNLAGWIHRAIAENTPLTWRNGASGHCLDQDYTGGRPNPPVIAGACHGGANQSWYRERTGAAVRVVNSASGHCLDQDYTGGRPNPAILAYPCHDRPNQLWTETVQPDGSSKLRNQASGQCIDQNYSGGTAGRGVQAINCHQGVNQNWFGGPIPPRNAPVINAQSTQCLDQDYSGGRPNPPVIAIGCHGGGNQGWHRDYLTTGDLRLTNGLSGQCLDQDYTGGQPHRRVIAIACHGGVNQRWFLVPRSDGTSAIRNRASGHCLDQDYTGGQPHRPVIAIACHGGGNQYWR